jgi:hypothetical protein
MPLYRKLPVTIEARQVTQDTLEDVAKWCGGIASRREGIELTITVHTLEGAMLARIGDYIIKGVRGEFYPCAQDIFEETYERVN